MVGIFFLFLQSFMSDHSEDQVFPDEISTILRLSCYDCHYTGATSEDAMKAVNFSEWEDYRLTKKVGTLGKICEVVEMDKMPPRKYLEHKPDRKMTEAHKKLLCEWTQKESDKLMQVE